METYNKNLSKLNNVNNTNKELEIVYKSILTKIEKRDYKVKQIKDLIEDTLNSYENIIKNLDK